MIFILSLDKVERLTGYKYSHLQKVQLHFSGCPWEKGESGCGTEIEPELRTEFFHCIEGSLTHLPGLC
jgi:hypothetical protein